MDNVRNDITSAFFLRCFFSLFLFSVHRRKISIRCFESNGQTKDVGDQSPPKKLVFVTEEEWTKSLFPLSIEISNDVMSTKNSDGPLFIDSSSIYEEETATVSVTRETYVCVFLPVVFLCNTLYNTLYTERKKEPIYIQSNLKKYQFHDSIFIH